MKDTLTTNHSTMRPFQRLLNKKRKAVHYRPKMAEFLMACANQEHQAMAALIVHWLDGAKSAKTIQTPPTNKYTAT
jgi:hypothetical protein